MQDMNLNARVFGVAGSVLGLLGVGLGAFGAHVLETSLGPGDLAVFETAVRYQLIHALALLAVALVTTRTPARAGAAAGWCFLAGTLFFSGSLYLLVLTGQRWLGAVTPLGGLAFLGGWAGLAWTFLRGGGNPGARSGA